MLKKLDHPMAWVILWSCFFAGFGFAVGEAVQRVNDARALNAVYQPKSILELAGEYFDARVTLFTLLFVIVAAVEAGFFFYQLRLKRQVMWADQKAALAAREMASEKRALLARFNEFNLEPELFASITKALNDA
jgi:4-hydroxybenzoate polyprenyltransferase